MRSSPVRLAVTTTRLPSGRRNAIVGVPSVSSRLAYGHDVVAALPLQSDTLHLSLQPVDNPLHAVQSVGVERADIQTHLWEPLSKRGSQVVAIETDRAVGGPGAAGVGRERNSRTKLHKNRNI